MLTAGRQHKYILCITDTFTKYALVTAIENKEAETVAKNLVISYGENEVLWMRPVDL